MSGGAEASANADNPLKVSASASAQFSTTSSRSHKVVNNEYRIDNRTHGHTAGFSWKHRTRERGDYYIHSIGSHTLFQTWPHLFNLERFSPISYSNFVPGFQVTYKIDPDERGKIAFTIRTTVATAAVYAQDVYAGTVHVRSNKPGRAITHTRMYDVARVDLNHPVFAREPTVYLQNLGHNNRVVDVAVARTDDGTPVITYPQHGGTNQLWGFDSLGRYISRMTPDICMTVEPDLTVAVRRTSPSLSQQWYWEEDKIYSRHVGSDPDVRYVLSMSGSGLAARLVVIPSTEADHPNSNWKPVLKSGL